MKKRVLAIAATAMATMMMASPVMAQDFKIGICNYVDDASLNQIVDNIQSRLEEIGKEKDVNFDVSYDNCNADANVMEQIISDFQADNVDLMVGIATPVAMRMQSATEGSDTPVVFSAVSDPVGSGLVDSLDAPGANITGTSDYLDTSSIMKLIQAQNPDVKKIGLLYDVGQDSSTTAIQEAKDYLDEQGIEYVERTGTTTDEVQLAADALIADAQARAQELVTQHEIMQKAYAQANDTINAANKQAQEILDSATQDANSIRLSAITYTDDMMANIGSVLTQTLEDAGGKYKGFIDSLQSCLDVVNHNRQELAPQTAQAAAITGSYHDNDGAKDDDDDLLDDLGEN